MYVSATANKKQLNRPTQGKLVGLVEAGRLTNKEGKQQTNVPRRRLEEDWVQGNHTAFHAKMSFTDCISAARSHSLVKL